MLLEVTTFLVVLLSTRVWCHFIFLLDANSYGEELVEQASLISAALDELDGEVRFLKSDITSGDPKNEFEVTQQLLLTQVLLLL